MVFAATSVLIALPEAARRFANDRGISLLGRAVSVAVVRPARTLLAVIVVSALVVLAVWVPSIGLFIIGIGIVGTCHLTMRAPADTVRRTLR
jgi:uncharacterized membrane protein YesL